MCEEDDGTIDFFCRVGDDSRQNIRGLREHREFFYPHDRVPGVAERAYDGFELRSSFVDSRDDDDRGLAFW